MDDETPAGFCARLLDDLERLLGGREEAVWGRFVTWAGERAGLPGPEAVTRLVLRRYLAYLTTLGRRKRTIARRAAALRRYFGWLRRTGRIAADPSVRLSAPKGEARLAPHQRTS